MSSLPRSSSQPPTSPGRRRPGRASAAALGALVLVVAIAPLAPDASTPPPAIEPSGGELASSSTAGAGRVTPAMQAEIDRVVAEGLAAPRVSARTSTTALAETAARCAELEGQRYCLGVGWTTRTEAEVAGSLAAAARTARSTGTETTGDLDQYAALARTARMAPAERAEAERRELVDAARSVAKIWLLRHEIQGVPLPAGFTEAHPEAVVSEASVTSRSTTSTTSTAPTSSRKGMADYPERSKILRMRQSSSQSRTYWCGPASAQAIVWGWRDRRQSQGHWANALGTTTSGTAITEMVRVVNGNTGWDRASHAGRYVVLDIADWSFKQWYLLMMRHIRDYRAPVVLHPILLKRYYPYLDDDASGHFQVGRGYDKNTGGTKQLGYIEVWDQSRFDPSEPRIRRKQWRSAYKSYRANQAHFQHNVGV